MNYTKEFTIKLAVGHNGVTLLDAPTLYQNNIIEALSLDYYGEMGDDEEEQLLFITDVPDKIGVYNCKVSYTRILGKDEDGEHEPSYNEHHFDIVDCSVLFEI